MTRLQTLFSTVYGHAPVSVTAVTKGAGSNRRYYRLCGHDGVTAIGVVGTARQENEAFIYLSHYFRSRGLPVPQVYAVSDDHMCYLQQDLGTTALYDALAEGRAAGEYSPQEVALLRTAICTLPTIQFCSIDTAPLDYSVCYPTPQFDRESIFFDLNYFKYCFVKAVGVEFSERELEADFRHLADDLLSDNTAWGFMYRDCQARNIMLVDNQPYFIDYQGGRYGPCYYDVASFLWQASARYSPALRTQLIDDYYTAARQYVSLPTRDVFLSRLRLFVLFRLLQVLGAYGFRGYFERKAYFINSLPPAIDNLREVLTTPLPYPTLVSLLRAITALPQFTPQPTPSQLIVNVTSFAYKYGLPTDASGHGGGYIFDCRGTNNPGRYKEYHSFTGLDTPVIDFLEQDGEIVTFLEKVYAIVDAHVERYLQRHFTHLSVAFGCTGGQHRSVYCAQQLAQHLIARYPIEVHLTHREQNLHTVLP